MLREKNSRKMADELEKLNRRKHQGDEDVSQLISRSRAAGEGDDFGIDEDDDDLSSTARKKAPAKAKPRAAPKVSALGQAQARPLATPHALSSRRLAV
jgi:hypothetical protein